MKSGKNYTFLIFINNIYFLITYNFLRSIYTLYCLTTNSKKLTFFS